MCFLPFRASGCVTRPSDVNNEKLAYESIGQPFPFVEVKIIDADGKLAKVNTDGEICFRGKKKLTTDVSILEFNFI